MRRAILATLIFFVAPVCAFAQQDRAAADSAAASGNGDATAQLLKKLVNAAGTLRVRRARGKNRGGGNETVRRENQLRRPGFGVNPEEAQEVLGGVPGVFLWDASELPNRKFVALVTNVAVAHSIPLQYGLITGYGEDSAAIQKSHGGVPTVNLVVPTRYTHAHNGIINRGDFDPMVDLVTSSIEKLDAGAVANLRNFAPPSE